MSAGGGSTKAAKPSSEERENWKQQTDIARGLWDSYQSLGAPVLEQLSGEALEPLDKDYDALASSRASAAGTDVEQAFGDSASRIKRQLERAGVRPDSGRFTATMRSLDLGRATSKAGAMTGARRSVIGDKRMDEARHDAKRFGVLSAALGQPGQALSGSLWRKQLNGGRAARCGQRGVETRGCPGRLARQRRCAALPFLFSDRRLKENAKVVGELKNGLKVYSYEPKGGGTPMIGLMADEVEKVAPEAVAELGGLKAVDYGEAVKEHPRKMGRRGQQKRAADTRRQGRQFLRETVPQAIDEAVETGTSYFDDAINTASSYFDDAVEAVTPYAEAVAEHTPKFAEWAAGEAREAIEPALAMARPHVDPLIEAATPYAEMAGREISRIPEYAEQAGREIGDFADSAGEAIGDFARENLPEDVAEFVGFMDTAEPATTKGGRRAAQEKAKAKSARQAKIKEMADNLNPRKWERLMDKVSAMDDTARERNADVIQMLQSKAPDMANLNREKAERSAKKRSETDDRMAQTQALLQRARQGDEVAHAAMQQSSAKRRQKMTGRR